VKAVITIGILLALQSAASLIWKNNQYHLPIYIAPETATFMSPGCPSAPTTLSSSSSFFSSLRLGAFLKYTRSAGDEGSLRRLSVSVAVGGAG